MELTDIYVFIDKVEKEIIFDFIKNWLIGFKTTDEVFEYPQFFGDTELETDDYFEMLSFVLAEPNRNYNFYFENENNLQNPKGMIFIQNNNMYLGIGVVPSYENHFINKLSEQYKQELIICNGVLPYK
ncbi:hypothetical protein [Chryseobacterium kwangjuense]|uniref:Uncharacterized protein n=1 Tax=Chryseobacterium kwangjuense TaxID=267125 RepID=A0A135W6H5_9FLAO|nr:hypothetical protein [Chryseobacterium kwangjuense]KXH80467.1 hypothetical protein AU378_18895 [Chryseobacterium kwangjuense]